MTDQTVVSVDPDLARWVSRGAHKLMAALAEFPVEVAGRRCVDVGSSTGGFTQVLIEEGARSVVALDVGSDQLADSLRADSRVTVREGTNVRDVASSAIGGPFDLAVVDLSFLSVKLIAGTLAELIEEGGDVIVLVKPQFELQRRDLGKGGVVREASKRVEAVRGVVDRLHLAGLGTRGLIVSPIEGGDGNVEYLLWCVQGAEPLEVEIPT